VESKQTNKQTTQIPRNRTDWQLPEAMDGE